MVEAVIELVLGDMGRFLTEQYNEYHLPINLVILAYGTLLMWAHLNLRRAARKMEQLIIDLAATVEPPLDVQLLFEAFRERWECSATKKKLFLPTPNDLWFSMVESADLIEYLKLQKEFLCIVLSKAGLLEPYGTLSKQTYRIWELYRHQLLTGMRARHLEPEVQQKLRKEQTSA